MILWQTKKDAIILCAPTPGLFLAKYSAEKTKYVDVSQPPRQGDELNRTLNRMLTGL